MGLFDDKTETYAYMGSSATLSPENYVDSIKSAIISAAINDNESIPQNILFGTKTGFQLYVDKYIKYGYDQYKYPPPKEYRYGVRDEEDKIKTRIVEEINTSEGKNLTVNDIDVEIFWTSFRGLSVGGFWNPSIANIDYAYYYLQKNWTLLAPTYASVWSPELGSATITKNSVNHTFNTVDLGVEYNNITRELRIYYNSTDIEVVDLPLGSVYFVKYTRSDDPLIPIEKPTRYWLYNPTSNTYPEILGKYYVIEEIRAWIPVTFFQIDKRPWDLNKSDPWYQSNIEIMDELGLSAKEVWEEFKKADSQQGEIWDMYIHFGCPINNSPHPKDSYVCQQYLYYFFKDNPRSFSLSIGGVNGYDNGYTIQDTIHTNHGTNRPSKFGSWDGVTYKPDNDRPEIYFSFSVWVEEIDPNTQVVSYKELRVVNLSQSILTNTGDGPRLAYAQDWANLYMEIQPEYFNLIKITYKERFLQSSLRGTVVLVEEVDIPWYQSGFWKVVFAVVVVVIAVALAQWQLAGTAATLFTVAGTAITWQTLSVLAFTVFLNVTAGYVYGDSLFGQILVFVASFVAAGGLTSLQGFNLENLINQGFGTALQAVKTTSTIVNYAASYYQKQKLEQLKEEYEELIKTYKEKQEELEAYYYGLGLNNSDVTINPITDIVKKGNNYIQETPDEFIGRTVNTNPGADMVRLISNFTDITLSLPKRPGQKNALEGIVEMVSGPRGYV
jgi:hypothetical protein